MPYCISIYIISKDYNMRYKNYLTETIDMKEWDILHTTLEKYCTPFIKQLKGVNTLLYRGSKKHTSFFDEVSQRQDRKPLYNNSDLSIMMDEWTNKHWGFKSRSQSTFTTASSSVANGYGRIYLVFPIGSFKYAWNADVTDLYISYDDFDYKVTNLYNKANKDSTSLSGEITIEQAKQLVYKEYILPQLKKYKTTGINKYLKMGPWTSYPYTECIVNCKTYYLINREWESTLLAWFSDRYWRK